MATKRKKTTARKPARKAAKRPARKTMRRAAGPGPKQQFLDAFRKEMATTRRVLASYPADQGEFRPHPRSNSAKQLIWTFTQEMMLASAAARGPLNLGGGMPAAPVTFEEVLAAFEKGVAEADATISKMPESRMGETVKFFTAPKQVGDVPVGQFLWFMLCDHIHHRGQLSVYCRMAGGKVPSIYGPSADEPWT
jgi:hypothetical protein